jgi:hypothetical protein
MVIRPGPHLSGLRLKMNRTRNGKDERMFSIELISKGDVKNISLDGDEKVLIEGSIGSLIHARFLDDIVLEVIGTNGELRVDLGVDELRLHPHKSEGPKEDGGCRQ